jgi:hypothetical protein
MASERATSTPRPCDLCGLPVLLDAFQAQTTEGTKHFCCEGCLGIYRLLQPDENSDRS